VARGHALFVSVSASQAPPGGCIRKAWPPARHRLRDQRATSVPSTIPWGTGCAPSTSVGVEGQDDVGMVRRGGGADLAFDAADRIAIGQAFFADELRAATRSSR